MIIINTYTNKYNSFKNKNYWKEQEDKDKNKEDNFIKKPMFTNSKLENNGNPEGNYVKIDLGGDNNIQKKSFNLFNIGEIQINNNANNSLSEINTNTKLKETEQKIEESNKDKNKEDINLPWRAGGNNKKEYYDLNGIKLSQEPHKGLYIIKDSNKTLKLYRK